MKASDLKALTTEARPIIERMLDDAEQLAAIRTAATERGIDWSQVKALLKAQIQDEREGSGEGRRVKAIIERADHASAYADMLGFANMNEKNFSAETPQPRIRVTEPTYGQFSQPSVDDGLEIPAILRRQRVPA